MRKIIRNNIPAVWGMCGLLSATSCITPKRPEGACYTRCGSALIGSVDCAGLQAVEDSAVREIGALHASWRYSLTPEQLCAELGNETVEVIPTDAGTFPDLWGREVYGESCTGYGVIAVGTLSANPDWTTTAYAHELAHLELGCAASVDHTGWSDGGVYDAIHAANASARDAGTPDGGPPATLPGDRT